MSKIAIVTDSTGSIPERYITEYPITIIPLQLIFGHDTYRDCVDVQPVEFYNMLETSKINATTSQPSPDAFIKVYKHLLEEEYDIVSIHISSKLSGTVDSAIQAKKFLNTDRIEVVDSTVTAMAMGFQVITLAKAIKEGASFTECKKLANQYKARTNCLFIVSTLEYLHRGGRIGGAAAFFGNAFDLKPILELRDGRIDSIGKVRTFKKAVDFLVNNFKNRVNGNQPVSISCCHAKASEDAVLLCNKIKEVVNVVDEGISEVSPVIGAHTGPGTIGVAYMEGV